MAAVDYLDNPDVNTYGSPDILGSGSASPALAGLTGRNSNVTSDQFAALSKKAGGDDVARAWLEDNPGDVLRGIDRGTFGSHGGSESVPTRTARINVPGQFTDPISSYLEQFAQKRAQQLESPESGSGQNLLEQALKTIAGQFGEGGYTKPQQEILNTQALEPIDQMRNARKQQVMVSLSQRNIDPNSGVGRSMLADVDRQFDQAKIQQRRTLANQAVNEQQQRLLQSVALLSQLAGTENQRLDQSYTYRTVPYNLQQQAFSNASNLYGSAGNPLALINPLLNLQGSQQNTIDSQGAALADILWMLTRGGN